jgi:ABC-2 type transport system permease protein
VVMLPSLFNLMVTTAYPVPSRVEMIQAVRVASDAAANAGSALLARYYEDHPEFASGDSSQAMTDFNIVKIAVDDDVARRTRPVIDRYERQLARQQAMIDRLRFVSPAVLMQDVLNDVAGTGVARHRHFVAQADRFHAQWRQFIMPLIFSKSRLTAADQAPAFAYEEEQTASVARRVLLGIVGLVLPAVAAAAIGLARLRRYPIVD